MLGKIFAWLLLLCGIAVFVCFISFVYEALDVAINTRAIDVMQFTDNSSLSFAGIIFFILLFLVVISFVLEFYILEVLLKLGPREMPQNIKRNMYLVFFVSIVGVLLFSELLFWGILGITISPSQTFTSVLLIVLYVGIGMIVGKIDKKNLPLPRKKK